MKVLAICCALLLPYLSSARTAQNHPSQSQRVQLTLDASEARLALVILHKEQAHEPITAADWQALFSTSPYQWLKLREASMHRDFTDEDFKNFLSSPEALARTAEWEHTLSAMEQADMQSLGQRVLEWLPSEAVIQARVFPEIKPRTNSFVWRNAQNEAAIFLYLQDQTQAQFENTVAHECHHIGLASLDAQQKKLQASIPENVKQAVEWTGALGEGEAMLAAAGSTERHPHWEDDAAARARWDSDMMHFNPDVAALSQFFMDILGGKMTSEAIQKQAEPFFGYQGAFYTVGYEMAVLVEKLVLGQFAFPQEYDAKAGAK